MRSAEYGGSVRLLPSILVFLLVALAVFPVSGTLSGQVVRGHLFDNESGHPVINGNVALRDSLGAVVARTATDEEGIYELTARTPGLYSLLAVGMGYRSTPIGQFEVSADEVTIIDIFLLPQPLELAPLSVEGRRQRVVASLNKHGFYDRQEQGFGSFLTPEQIQRWPALNVGDVLKHAPFVYAEWNLSGSTISISRGGRRCSPGIFVDGNRITSSPEHWVNPDDIVAVEVYRGESQIPLQWAGLETCGVILIWTVLGGGGGTL
jgi:hypothetical protein